MADEQKDQAREERINQAIADYLASPQPPDPKEWMARYPDLADELAAFLADKANFDRFAQSVSLPPAARKEGLHLTCPHCHNPIELLAAGAPDEVQCPSCGSSFRLEPAATIDWKGAGRRLGKFELLDEVGTGAFGTVYKARDTELDRTVAVKVPRAGNLPGGADLDRFLREARSVAQLRHPAIVPVYEVGQADGVPYLVSAFVEGVTLTDQLSARRPDPRAAAALVATLADALAYAHGQGVIHRDVKPSNVMLDAQGQPHLMDFGLAKRQAGEITMTVDGQVLGTPAYMSPEQAKGEAHQVDGRADIYSLGVILYQLLTGVLPFRGTARMLLYQVLHDDPPPPRRLNDRIPRDLETICLACLRKEPIHRFASAKALADDLRRALAGEPIQARPVSFRERAVKWVRRRPMVAALLAAVVLVSAVGLGAFAWAFRQTLDARDDALGEKKIAQDEKTKADAARKDAEEQKTIAEKALGQAKKELFRFETMHYIDRIAAADKALQENDFIAARWNLDECRADLRHVEHAYLSKQLAQRGPRALRGDTGWARCLALSRDGKRLCSGSYDQTIKVWDLEAGTESLTLRAHTGVVSSLALSADGKRLFSGSYDKTIKVWDLEAGKETLSLRGHTGLVLSLALSSDSKRLFSGSGDNTIKVWDLETGKETLSLRAQTGGVTSLALSADGNRLFSGGADNSIKVWDLETGKETLSLRGHTRYVSSVVSSSDGKRLFSGSHDKTIKVWDLEEGKVTHTLLGHTQVVTSLALSADGKRLFSGSYDKTIKVWDPEAGKETLSLGGHTGEVISLALSADGKRLFSGSYERTIKMWDLEAWNPDKSGLNLRGHTGGVMSLALSADGKRLFSGGGFQGNTQPKVWNQVLHVLVRQWWDREDNTIKVWNLESGKESLSLRGHTGWVSSLALLSDGKRILSGSYDKTIKAWGLEAGKETLSLRGHTEPVESLALSVDGKRLFSGSDDKTIKVWDLDTGKEILSLRGHTGWVISLALSPDGKRLYSGSDDNTIKVWDVEAGKEMHNLRGHTGVVSSLALSADGKRLFSGGGFNDNTIKVWDLETGKETLSLRGHTEVVQSLALSADGKRLFSGSYDKTIKVWNLDAGKETLTLRGHLEGVRSLALSPDGKRLFSGSYDKTIKVWDFGADK